MSPIIRLEGITKHYGTGSAAFEALRGITIDVERGEFVAVIGPSGSGKSTLLNVMAGLDVPTSGRVIVGGEDLATLSEDARSRVRGEVIGFVFQSFNLFPALTAAENVAWPLEFAGIKRAHVETRVSEVLAMVGMLQRAQQRPATLSGGEQQRVAIARALVREPAVVLADEPTGNLDSATGDAVLQLLESLCARRGVTVVMVTHRPDARTRGGRVIEIRDGLVHADVVPSVPLAR